MKKQNSRRLILVAVGLLAAVVLVVVSAAASVLAYRQFVEEDNTRANLRVDGLRVEQNQDVDSEGIIVLRVEPGSPAEQAGLSRGSVILSVNGRPVNSPEELKEAIGEYEAGDTVTLTLKDDASTTDVSVTLADAGPYLGVNVGPGGDYRFHAQGFGEMPEGFVMPRLPGHRGLPGNPGLPGSSEDMPFEFHFDQFDFEHFDFDQFGGEHGPFLELFGQSAFVMSVEEGSPAGEAGLLAGDAIVEVNGIAVEGNQDLIDALVELSSGDDVSLQVQRGEESLTIEATLAPHPEDSDRSYLGVFLAPGIIHREMELFEEQRNS